MKLSPQEKADRRAAFHRMSVPEKLEYILAYYKLPIVLVLIALIFLGTVISHAVTRKNHLLFLGFVNVSVGEDLEDRLTDRFLEATGADPKRNDVYTYTGLYLSDHPAEENHEYSYASKLKILAAINARQMDLVLLNREAYDICSHSGYLLDLSEFLQQRGDPELYGLAASCLSENDVVLSDNAIEMELGTADAYRADVETAVNGLEVSGLPAFRTAEFQEPVFLCVIANSPRLSEILDYMGYILSVDFDLEG